MKRFGLNTPNSAGNQTREIAGASYKQLPQELAFKDGGRVIGSNGEINAYDKADLLRASTAFCEAASRGQIFEEGNGVYAQYTEAQRKEVAKRNRELVYAAMSDSNQFKEIAAQAAQFVSVTNNRKGYARRFLLKEELKQGDVPRIPVVGKNVVAQYVSSARKVETTLVNDNYIWPVEFQIAARIYIRQNEINQSSHDILEQKYNEMLQAFMVAEDRLWLKMARETANTDNQQTVITGYLQPASLASVKNNIDRWGLKSEYLLMASNLWIDIIGDSTFIQAIEPVARHELLLKGELGVMYGMTIITEQYRHPEHKVLNPGEFFVVSSAATHGAYGDRNGIDASPLDMTTERIPGRGWNAVESLFMSIANNRSVASGYRP
jgi:hypothetical protein